MERNDTPGGSRGQGTVVWADDRDPITTPQGKSQRDRARDLLTPLRVEYPVLAEYRPLSIGIREAVHAAFPDVSRSAVIHALARHCRCDRYIEAIAAGGSRYALDGAQFGEVSEDIVSLPCWSWRGERKSQSSLPIRRGYLRPADRFYVGPSQGGVYDRRNPSGLGGTNRARPGH